MDLSSLAESCLSSLLLHHLAFSCTYTQDQRRGWEAGLCFSLLVQEGSQPSRPSIQQEVWRSRRAGLAAKGLGVPVLPSHHPHPKSDFSRISCYQFSLGSRGAAKRWCVSWEGHAGLTHPGRWAGQQARGGEAWQGNPFWPHSLQTQHHVCLCVSQAESLIFIPKRK